MGWIKRNRSLAQDNSGISAGGYLAVFSTMGGFGVLTAYFLEGYLEGQIGQDDSGLLGIAIPVLMVALSIFILWIIVKTYFGGPK